VLADVDGAHNPCDSDCLVFVIQADLAGTFDNQVAVRQYINNTCRHVGDKARSPTGRPGAFEGRRGLAVYQGRKLTDLLSRPKRLGISVDMALSLVVLASALVEATVVSTTRMVTESFSSRALKSRTRSDSGCGQPRVIPPRALRCARDPLLP